MVCERAYGFLPCAEDLAGSLFLMVVYGYFLLQGANLLSEGSEMLLEVLDPGVVGGLLLPILGAMPDALIILISGLGGSEDKAQLQKEVAVGMGTLAGSTVMLLTIAWGGSVILGRCDLDASGSAVNKTLTKPFEWSATGVTSDKATPFNAVIMVATSVLYFTVQVPAWLGHPRPHKIAVIGAALCFVCLLVYCSYQVIVPELQKRKMAAARSKLMRENAVHGFQTYATRMFGSLVDARGELRREIVEKIFAQFDHDQSGTIDASELHALLTGLQLITSTDDGEALEQQVALFMKDFDDDDGGTISRDEFFLGMKKWVTERLSTVKREIMAAAVTPRTSAVGSLPASGPGAGRMDMHTALLIDQHGTGDAIDVMDNDEDVEEDEPMTHAQLLRKAISLLALGTAICAIFSDPMVGAVAGFATATEIPSFFVAFVVTPLASNASELVSSLKFAMGKRQKNISLTFCQVYGAVTMNNCMCLGLFLFVVFLRDLEWTFSAEVLATIIPTAIVGTLGASGVTFKTWVALPVLLIYPASLLLVFLLER